MDNSDDEITAIFTNGGIGVTIYQAQGILFQNKINHRILQNDNGPCPLLAICNALLLRDTWSIPMKQLNFKVPLTFKALIKALRSQLDVIHQRLLIDEQLNDADIDDKIIEITQCIDIFPSLEAGLDINIKYSDVNQFEMKELAHKFFNIYDVNIYHCWVIDPDGKYSQIFKLISNKSYNEVQDMLINRSNSSNDNSIIISQINSFLHNTSQQQTKYGVNRLYQEMNDNEIAILFHNNHYSTIYKHMDDHIIYQLVTDQGIVDTENRIIWKTFNPSNYINTCDEIFVDSNFNAINDIDKLHLNRLRKIINYYSKYGYKHTLNISSSSLTDPDPDPDATDHDDANDIDDISILLKKIDNAIEFVAEFPFNTSFEPLQCNMIFDDNDKRHDQLRDDISINTTTNTNKLLNLPPLAPLGDNNLNRAVSDLSQNILGSISPNKKKNQQKNQQKNQSNKDTDNVFDIRYNVRKCRVEDVETICNDLEFNSGSTTATDVDDTKEQSINLKTAKHRFWTKEFLTDNTQHFGYILEGVNIQKTPKQKQKQKNNINGFILYERSKPIANDLYISDQPNLLVKDLSDPIIDDVEMNCKWKVSDWKENDNDKDDNKKKYKLLFYQQFILITDIRIHPKSRNKGLGSKLLQTIIYSFQSGTKFAAQINSSNDYAMRCFGNCGFKISRIEKNQFMMTMISKFSQNDIKQFKTGSILKKNDKNQIIKELKAYKMKISKDKDRDDEKKSVDNSDNVNVNVTANDDRKYDDMDVDNDGKDDDDDGKYSWNDDDEKYQKKKSVIRTIIEDDDEQIFLNDIDDVDDDDDDDKDDDIKDQTDQKYDPDDLDDPDDDDGDDGKDNDQKDASAAAAVVDQKDRDVDSDFDLNKLNRLCSELCSDLESYASLINHIDNMLSNTIQLAEDNNIQRHDYNKIINTFQRRINDIPDFNMDNNMDYNPIPINQPNPPKQSSSNSKIIKLIFRIMYYIGFVRKKYGDVNQKRYFISFENLDNIWKLEAAQQFIEKYRMTKARNKFSLKTIMNPDQIWKHIFNEKFHDKLVRDRTITTLKKICNRIIQTENDANTKLKSRNLSYKKLMEKFGGCKMPMLLLQKYGFEMVEDVFNTDNSRFIFKGNITQIKEMLNKINYEEKLVNDMDIFSKMNSQIKQMWIHILSSNVHGKKVRDDTIKTLKKICNGIISNPFNQKARNLNLSKLNAKFQCRIPVQLLEEGYGFQRTAHVNPLNYVFDIRLQYEASDITPIKNILKILNCAQKIDIDQLSSNDNQLGSLLLTALLANQVQNNNNNMRRGRGRGRRWNKRNQRILGNNNNNNNMMINDNIGDAAQQMLLRQVLMDQLTGGGLQSQQQNMNMNNNNMGMNNLMGLNMGMNMDPNNNNNNNNSNNMGGISGISGLDNNNNNNMSSLFNNTPSSASSDPSSPLEYIEMQQYLGHELGHLAGTFQMNNIKSKNDLLNVDPSMVGFIIDNKNDTDKFIEWQKNNKKNA